MLNGLITARLGNCLPPNCNSHYLYMIGIQRIAIIYSLFEDIWEKRLAKHNKKSPCTCQTCAKPFFSNLSDRHADIYRQVAVPNIMRCPRLEWDMHNMGNHDLQTCYPPQFAEVYNILNKLDHGPCLDDFLLRMQEAFATKPHVLLSYTWLFYMALFFGGKFIYQQLNSAGLDFWPPLTEQERRGMSAKMPDGDVESPGWPYLHFWRFDDTDDGKEGILTRTAFEKGFHAASLLLTEQERQDVVEECQEIYHHLEMMIYDLDKDCALVKRALPQISHGLAKKREMSPLVTAESDSPPKLDEMTTEREGVQHIRDEKAPNSEVRMSDINDESSNDKEEWFDTKDTSSVHEEEITSGDFSGHRFSSHQKPTIAEIPKQVQAAMPLPFLLWAFVTTLASKLWFYISYPFIDQEAVTLGASPWRF